MLKRNGLKLPVLGIGVLIITGGVWEALKLSDQCIEEFINRFTRGDWGEVLEQERLDNDRALATRNTEIRGVYQTNGGEKFYIFSEAGRHFISVRLPTERV